MNSEIVNLLNRVESLPWREALDEILLHRRREFIFDNVALYRQREVDLEVEYARAFGRGRAAEADAAWGEQMAADVLQRQEILLIQPSFQASTADRLERAYLLGFPIALLGEKWALVFARFGGPVFDELSQEQAAEVVWLIKFILSQRLLKEKENVLEQLRRQLGIQEDFLSTISHQLRTPLGLIKGYVSSLLRPNVRWDAATQRKFLSVIEQETDRLTTLIDNLLASSAWEAKAVSLNFAPLHLESLVRDAAIRARYRYPKMEIYLSSIHLPPVWGDAVQLAQVLDNLFSNVAQHAQQAPVTIRYQIEDEFLHLIFRDGGPGMPPQVLANLFQRFQRPAPTSGSGLGLYICRKIVEAHGGKIWAESAPGEGSTFHIFLPLVRNRKETR